MIDVAIANRLVELKHNAVTPAFSLISIGQIEKDLRKRMCKPELIHQKGTSLCGPACLMYWIAKDMPRVYGNYVLDLFEKGKARLGKIEVEPGSSCKKFDPLKITEGHSNPAAVDWIALASLKDSENSIFNYDDVSDAFAGITGPGRLAAWFKLAGYSDVINTLYEKGKGYKYIHQKTDALDEANQLFRSGYRVNLLLHSQVLRKGYANSSFLPNHWVALVDQIQFSEKNDEKHINAEVYTWGEIRRLRISESMKVENFLDDFYGIVAAK